MRVVVVVVALGAGEQKRLILKMTRKQHPQQIIVMISDVMALKNICGRLSIITDSSSTFDATVGVKQLIFSSLQCGSMQLTIESFSYLELMHDRLTFFLHGNSWLKSAQSKNRNSRWFNVYSCRTWHTKRSTDLWRRWRQSGTLNSR